MEWLRIAAESLVFHLDVCGWMSPVPYLQPAFCGNKRCLIPLCFLKHWLPHAISGNGKAGVPVVQPSQECVGSQLASRGENMRLWHKFNLVMPWRLTEMSTLMDASDVEKALEEIFIILDVSHFQSKFSPLWIIRDMKVNEDLSSNFDIHNSSLLCEFLDDTLFMLNLNINWFRMSNDFIQTYIPLGSAVSSLQRLVSLLHTRLCVLYSLKRTFKMHRSCASVYLDHYGIQQGFVITGRLWWPEMKFQKPPVD